MVKTLGIIGGGVVGHASARTFLEHCEVRVHDILPAKSTHSLDDTLACDLVMVCLPTPQCSDAREADISCITQFFERAARHKPDGCYVIRSTVPIGTTRMLGMKYDISIAHSPEFLTARCAVTDAQLPARNIIGGNSQAAMRLFDLYRQRFPHVQVLRMTSDESEAVKLFQNSFFAVKVAFFNEINRLSAKRCLDWSRVLTAMMADGRIAHSHTLVPGPDGKYGFGGACLPKDLSNLIDCCEKAGIDATVCRAASERNYFDRERR